MILLLDAGHGYDTQGKESPVWPDGTQLQEWSFNRDVVNRIYALTMGAGISTFKLTADMVEDKDVSLSERTKRANRYGKDALLVSVHGNAAAQNGWEAWYWHNSAKSKAYAQVFLDAARVELKEYRMRGLFASGGDGGKGFAILRDTVMPAVLTENLFWDNPDESRFMLSEEGRRRIAQLHFEAIRRIWAE